MLLENLRRNLHISMTMFFSEKTGIIRTLILRPAASVAVPFLVRITITDLNIRKGPGTDYDRTQFSPVGVYTIVEVKSGKGSTAGWGRLKSGSGWISLDFVNKL